MLVTIQFFFSGNFAKTERNFKTELYAMLAKIFSFLEMKFLLCQVIKSTKSKKLLGLKIIYNFYHNALNLLHGLVILCTNLCQLIAHVMCYNLS